VLITGASGFLGRHLIHVLQEKEVEIHAITLRPTQDIGTQHEVSLADVNGLKNALIKIRPDYIVHLAGITHAPNVSAYYTVNTSFAANLIWAIKEWGNLYCPIVLTGTSAEYGLIDKDQLPITEITPANPYDHYGISKLAQTLMGVREARDGLPLIMIRPFNIIGPGMPSHLALQSFVEQVKKIINKEAEPIIETGDLSPSRDFVDVRDVADVIWQLLSTPAAYGEVINICTGIGTAIGELLNRLIDIANINVKLHTAPHRVKNVDIPIHFGSLEKLHKLTGFTPKRNLETTLQDVLEYSLATTK